MCLGWISPSRHRQWSVGSVGRSGFVCDRAGGITGLCSACPGAPKQNGQEGKELFVPAPSPRARKIYMRRREGTWCCVHIRIGIAGSDHDLLHGLVYPFLRARVPGGPFSNRSVHIWLVPQSVGPVLEEVEVVRIVSHLLRDLELDVLVVQAGIKGPGSFFVGKMELAGEEEAGDLAGS